MGGERGVGALSTATRAQHSVPQQSCVLLHLSEVLQLSHLMRFLEVIRGVRTAAPTKLLPVMKMPLRNTGGERGVVSNWAAASDGTQSGSVSGQTRPTFLGLANLGAFKGARVPRGAEDAEADGGADSHGGEHVGVDLAEQEPRGAGS